MDYNGFKEEVLKRLKEQHGDVMEEIEVTRVKKNNGVEYEGVIFRPNEAGGTVIAPVLHLDTAYEAYIEGDADEATCAEVLWEEYEQNKASRGLQQFAGDICRWDFAKRNVYPFLLSAEGNRELLSGLVSVPVLDLAVIFIIHGIVSGAGWVSVKLTDAMLEGYGVTRQELYYAAMANMENDGYSFQDIDYIIGDMLRQEGLEDTGSDMAREKEMFVLSNSSKQYGAAGILNRKLIREFANGRDMYILPSSIHETIFVPASDKYSVSELNRIVADINEMQVAVEERLTDHCYFYDAKRDEIRMEP